MTGATVYTSYVDPNDRAAVRACPICSKPFTAGERGPLNEDTTCSRSMCRRAASRLRGDAASGVDARTDATLRYSATGDPEASLRAFGPAIARTSAGTIALDFGEGLSRGPRRRGRPVKRRASVPAYGLADFREDVADRERAGWLAEVLSFRDFEDVLNSVESDPADPFGAGFGHDRGDRDGWMNFRPEVHRCWCSVATSPTEVSHVGARPEARADFARREVLALPVAHTLVCSATGLDPAWTGDLGITS